MKGTTRRTSRLPRPICGPSSWRLVVESKSKPQVVDANFDATAECSKSAVTATSMTAEMEAALKGCPFKDYLEDVKKAFDKKGKVTVDRQGNDVKIVIEVGDVINELNGSW